MPRILTLTLVAVVATPVAAQSVNVDFGIDFGTPDFDYAAAGTAGHWNGVADPDALPLVGLFGLPTPVTVDASNEVFGFDDPATNGAEEQLLDDGLFGWGDIVTSIDFAGLADGSYELIVYAWAPTMPDDVTLIFFDDKPWDGTILGGPWPGGLVEGVTHATRVIEVSGGSASVAFVGGIFGASGFVNAIQLRPLEPLFDEADLDYDGIVGFEDLLLLLAHWTERACDGSAPCPDLDGDGRVGFGDLVQLLNAWTV